MAPSITDTTLAPTLLDTLTSFKTQGFRDTNHFSEELLHVLRVNGSQPEPVIHEQVRRRLIDAANGLDSEDRLLFLTVAGLTRGSAELAGERVRQAVELLHMSESSVQRRYPKVARKLARVCASRWALDVEYVFVHAHTRVDLRDDTPVVVTERTISVLSDGVDHFTERTGAPSLADSDLRVRALEGCTLLAKEPLGPGIWQLQLGFPRTLLAGDHHTFVLSYRFPNRESLAPVIGFLPHHASYNGILDLNFGHTLPASLERFRTPPPVDGLHRIPGSEIIRDVQARHRFEFPQMKPGLCYGVRWHWTDPEA